MGLSLSIQFTAVVLGLLFGSFLNVCISRLPYHESVVRPRSRCPQCQQVIRWYDNIPLLSWAILRARCRSCAKLISWRYPAVELAVALWFLLGVNALHVTNVFQRASLTDFAGVMPMFIGFLSMGFLLIGLLVMDWQTHRLPDAFTFTGIAIGFVLTCIQAMLLPSGVGDIHLNHSLRLSSPGSVAAQGNIFLTGPEVMVMGRLLAILAAGGLLWLIARAYKATRKREGLGMGDAKLIAMIAAYLGFWPAMLALFIGVVACAVYAGVLLARGRATTSSHVPLGTFLCIGGLLAASLGAPILSWYIGFF